MHICALQGLRCGRSMHAHLCLTRLAPVMCVELLVLQASFACEKRQQRNAAEQEHAAKRMHVCWHTDIL
jgi:hypothetical protein